MMGNNWHSILIVISLLAAKHIVAQPGAKLIAEIPVEAAMLESDIMGNCYVADSQNTLYKYSPTGDLMAIFQQRQLGRIQSIDATNPLKIIAFYPDFGKVITLDNELAVIGQTDLNMAGILDVDALAGSRNNRLILFDQSSNKLLQIDEAGTIVSNGEDLSTLGIYLQAVCIREQKDRIIVADPNSGLYSFDLFLSYLGKIHETGISRFSVHNNQVYFVKDGAIFTYHLNNFTLQQMAIPIQGEILHFSIQKQYLFVASAYSVSIFQY